MKKNLLTTLVCCLFTVSSFSQILVKENGHVNIGTEPTEDVLLETWRQDTLTTLKIFGPFGDLKAGARLSFGDLTYFNQNVLLGELGNVDSDQLWVQATHGYYFTAQSNANDTIAYYDNNKGNYFRFNCEVRANGVYVASDSRFKKDIEPLENSLSGLQRLSAVSYKLKSPFGTTATSRAAVQSAGSSKDQKEASFRSKFYQSLQNDSTHFGFIAQDVKNVYPELVRTDSTGYMYVDYIGMIPLLVNAINELQAKIDDLESAPESSDDNSGRSLKTKSAGSPLEESVMSNKLYQNAPNPFNAVTSIKYSLASDAQQANLYIYDLQGHQIKNIELFDQGENTVTLQGSDLQAGMYIYSLIVDGKEIDNKRMILTK